MLSDEPQCIIRHDDDPNFLSKTMSCEVLIEEVLAGRWGEQCRIQEVYLFGPEYTYVLRNIAHYSTNNGFHIIEVDEYFNSFVSNIKKPLPESPAISTLRSFLLQQTKNAN